LDRSVDSDPDAIDAKLRRTGTAALLPEATKRELPG
jgi:hypothetical protein